MDLLLGFVINRVVILKILDEVSQIGLGGLLVVGGDTGRVGNPGVLKLLHSFLGLLELKVGISCRGIQAEVHRYDVVICVGELSLSEKENCSGGG